MHVLEHLIVPEPQHEKSSAFQKRGALRVGGNRVSVLAAVEFDDKHALKTDEINDVIAERVLAAELAAIQLPQTQALPQGTLGVG